MRLPPPQNTQPQKHIQVAIHESCKSSSHHRAKGATEYSLLKSENKNDWNKKSQAGYFEGLVFLGFAG